jgi:zinc protease
MTFFTELRKEDSLDAARAAFLETIEGMGAKPATVEEVDRAKNTILKNIELSLTSPDQVGVALSESAAAGDWRLFFVYRDEIKKVTPADVQRVATSYLKQTNRTLGTYIPTQAPERSEIPETPNVAERVRNYKGDAALASGEEFDASPANIEARTTRRTLPGGIKLALLPKTTRGEIINAQIVLNLGDEKSLMNRKTAAELAASMLLRGTKSKTRQQIKDELDRLKAVVNVGGGPTRASVSIEVKRPQFPEVLKLVREVLREPSFDAAEFEILRKERLASTENVKSEPSVAASIELSRHLKPRPKGHALYIDSLDESIANLKSVTLDQVKSFYRDFYGASSAQMAVVGNFDASEVGKLVESLFSDWKSPKPFVRIASTYVDVPSKNNSLETPDKANAFFIAGVNLPIRDDDPDYPALVLANYMVGGSPLTSRLLVRWRQKEGLSYGGASIFNASALDKEGAFTAFAVYAPENLARLEKAFAEEMERAVKDGFDADEVAKGKNGLLQARQVSRAQDNSLTGTLASYLFLDRTLKWDIDLEQRISALTPEQVTDAFRRRIDPKKVSIVKAGDFAKKKKSAEVARPASN